MCGIAGFSLRAAADRTALAAMTATLAHRGPDGEGFFVEGGVGLGHCRLSILDIEGGAQPMANETGSVTVVYNGEIYNYLELRSELQARGHSFATRSDTEVLVHLYEEEGQAFPVRLNGIFAFALYDRERRLLLLARDPVGVKPLYYADVPGGLLFASELKALRAHPAFPAELDLEALKAYLTCEYVPAPLSIYRRARKLLPGHLLTIGPEGAQLKRYWSWDIPGSPDFSREEAPERLRAEVQRSVAGQLVSDVPLGVFLSGGVDSSIVAACMTGAGGSVESFSIGFEDPSFDESAYARAAAEHLGCDHHEHAFSERELLDEVPRVLGMLDEPFADPSVFPTALLSRFARRHVTVALGGDGGDELFAGYPTYWVHRRYGLYRAMPGFLRRAGLGRRQGPARLPRESHPTLQAAEVPRRRRAHHAAQAAPVAGRLDAGAPRPPDAGPRFARRHAGRLDTARAVKRSGHGRPVAGLPHLPVGGHPRQGGQGEHDGVPGGAGPPARSRRGPHGLLHAVELEVDGRAGKAVFREAFARDFPAGHFGRPKKGFGIPIARWLSGRLSPSRKNSCPTACWARCPSWTPQNLAGCGASTSP